MRRRRLFNMTNLAPEAAPTASAFEVRHQAVPPRRHAHDRPAGQSSGMLEAVAVFKTGPAIGLTCMIPISLADLGTYSA